MRPDRPPTPVAIIGGGFSGTMVAAQLARRGVCSVLIEGGNRTGQGVAYSTAEPAHLLNVRAEAMSAWQDDLEHFSRAFGSDGGDPSGFAERRLFGRYLRSILDEAIASGRVTPIEQKAVAAEPAGEGWAVRLDDEAVVHAEALVLGIGNQPPEPLPFATPESPRVINNPWGSEAAAAVAEVAQSHGDVLIVGTGLTMIDMVLSLDEAGHRGRIVALSRRGLIPRAHADFKPALIDQSDVPHGSVRELWRWLRRRGAEVGWRAAIDSLRPHSHRLWQSFGPKEQLRFLRHARPWWDVHRHRIAPEVARRIHDLVATGRLEVVAGRVMELRENSNGLIVRIKRRAQSLNKLGTNGSSLVQVVFNCTGPLGTISRTGDPMLRQMLDDGLVRPDALGIGLEVDERSRLANVERAWAMGPLTKGRYWEIVAVPDIRGQAADVAEDIAMELRR